MTIISVLILLSLFSFVGGVFFGYEYAIRKTIKWIDEYSEINQQSLDSYLLTFNKEFKVKNGKVEDK